MRREGWALPFKVGPRILCGTQTTNLGSRRGCSPAWLPALGETDFYDANISARYGLSHLKFCISAAGNEVSALAMYNAGTQRVRSNKTPLTTLNYIGKILTYQRMLEQLFEEQVTPYFEDQTTPVMTVAYAGRK